MQKIYPVEINLLHVLSFASAGLTFFDIFRLCNLGNEDLVKFGDWENFLRKLVNKDE